ncbi:sulfate/molybdate ABC transporter ATP-binding protein [Halorubrum coriense DSM 10284]|uniref:Molybdate/tungstate import ATP-binding protein WtpC n=1 Tax=Halorubrum coriense DSM 10284 TaxID=1227466 RepID=M0E970_9EURY|nr:ABC transporter ATP-binding protein [Halorubrum coriense]ELZ43427.1 sulfate/molybdate ABC transporter ATP-binding protein [Halorubrum coriense DSM 10284]
MATITLETLTKQFDSTTAVDAVSLTINDGEVLGIVGPSGCGKTTTLRLIAGFETATEGTIQYDDEDMTHVPPENRNVGLVFQGYALFNNMTVRQNVTFGPKMHGVRKQERRERANELLELLDIRELADRAPQTLSGGQQQRVGLARALAIEPRILLLDEPMTGLDAQLKRSLRRELGELLDELDVTTLYVTHDQEQAMAMCDRIAVMNDGHVEQVSTPADIYESPANEFVANFIGTTNIVATNTLAGAVDTETAPDQGSTQNGHRQLAVRPDDFVVGSGPIEAQIANLFYLGEQVQLIVTTGDGTELTVHCDRFDADGLSVGDQITMDVETSRIHAVNETQ